MFVDAAVAAIEAPGAVWHPGPAVEFDARVLRRRTCAPHLGLRLPGKMDVARTSFVRMSLARASELNGWGGGWEGVDCQSFMVW